MVKIGVDASRAAVAQRTGTERYSLEVIRALLRVDHRNDYLLYFNQPPAQGLIQPGPNWQARNIPQARLWTHLRLSRELASDRPDLLFVPAHVLPIRHPARSVVTIHDVGFRFFPEAHRLLSRAYLDLSTRWAARRATRLIVPSAATGRDLARLFGVTPDRLRVVYEGVDPEFRPLEPQEAAAILKPHYDLEQGQYLLAIGTVQPRKNLLGLLQAFRLFVDQQGSRCELILAGRAGLGASRIQAETERLGLQRQVRWLGYVPDQHLAPLYSGALAYLLPSFYEGFGLTALEALACGAPIIASKIPALVEVVGPAGLLVDPRSPGEIAQAIGRLLDNPSLRSELATNGPKRAAQFSWERCARETLEVLIEAAGTARVEC